MTDHADLPPECASEKECDQLAALAQIAPHDIRALLLRVIARAAYFEARHESMEWMRAVLRDAARIGEVGAVASATGQTCDTGRPVFVAVAIGDAVANLHRVVSHHFKGEPAMPPPTIDTPNRKGPGQ